VFENITISCNTGYFLDGPEVKTCMQNGSFVGDGHYEPSDVSSCVLNVSFCPPLSDPVDGVVDYNASVRSYLSVASFSCNLGWVLDGGSTITCQADGTWDTQPTCKALGNFCPNLGTLTNGATTYTNLSDSKM
jgi:hypothetical protein